MSEYEKLKKILTDADWRCKLKTKTRKHSAEPWRATHRRIENCADPSRTIIGYVHGSDGEEVCVLFGGTDQEVLANASMLAAAPTMKHAIINALNEFRPKECGCDGDCIDGRNVGYPCYFHRIERELKQALAEAEAPPGVRV